MAKHDMKAKPRKFNKNKPQFSKNNQKQKNKESNNKSEISFLLKFI